MDSRRWTAQQRAAHILQLIRCGTIELALLLRFACGSSSHRASLGFGLPYTAPRCLHTGSRSDARLRTSWRQYTSARHFYRTKSSDTPPLASRVARCQLGCAMAYWRPAVPPRPAPAPVCVCAPQTRARRDARMTRRVQPQLPACISASQKKLVELSMFMCRSSRQLGAAILANTTRASIQPSRTPGTHVPAPLCPCAMVAHLPVAPLGGRSPSTAPVTVGHCTDHGDGATGDSLSSAFSSPAPAAHATRASPVQSAAIPPSPGAIKPRDRLSQRRRATRAATASPQSALLGQPLTVPEAKSRSGAPSPRAHAAAHWCMAPALRRALRRKGERERGCRWAAVLARWRKRRQARLFPSRHFPARPHRRRRRRLASAYLARRNAHG